MKKLTLLYLGALALCAGAALALDAVAWTQTNVTTSGSVNTATRISTNRATQFRGALFVVPGASPITIGPDSNANFYTIPAGTAFALPMRDQGRFDLYDWYMQSPTATQQLKVAFQP